MSYSFHGNYCGPGYTAGKYIDAKDATKADFTVPAVDQLDAICKKHDKAIWKAHRVVQKSKKEILLKIADKTFVREIKNANIPGIKDDVAGFLVWALGPSKKLREVETEDDGTLKRKANDEKSPNVGPKKYQALEDENEDEDYDVEMNDVSLLKLPQSTNMSEADKANQDGRDETRVDNMKSKLMPWKKTEQVIMPFYSILGTEYTISTGAKAGAVQWGSIRLNSIYDILTNVRANYTWSNGTATLAGDYKIGKPSSDSADATLQQPAMRKYWMSIYDFYTVVKTTWRIRFIPTTKDDEGEYTAYLYLHGAQYPPVYDQKLDNNEAFRVEHLYRTMHPQCLWKHFRALPKIGTDSTVGYNQNNYACEFSGTWTPGSIDKDVLEDDLGEIWIHANETPKSPDLLTFYVQKSPMSKDVELKFRVEVNLQYHVQLKDLKPEFKYITERTEIPALPRAFESENASGSRS